MKQKKENCTNENTLLTMSVSDIFVVKNAKNRAFIEQFSYKSVNFTQRDLGTILGFFVVRDKHSSSENIVNYLASEVKKQYFLPTQKPIEDKFESTLHHINRVLEEVANVGNIEWLGHIDGAICVIDNDSIHISVTGNAHVLLLRDNILQDISEGLASEESSQYPLKTFIDIASGDLCPHDKIIITSQELLDLISFTELQKNAIRFGQENFIQFIQTVLTNECSIASTTVIDIKQDQSQQPQVDLKPVEIPENLFGADAFEKNASTITSTEESDIIDNIDEEELELNVDELIDNEIFREYTDEKTGHIYIQGTDELIEDDTPIVILKERIYDFYDTCKKFIKKHKYTATKKVTNSTSQELINNQDDATITEDVTFNPKESDNFSDYITDDLEKNCDEFDDEFENQKTSDEPKTTHYTPQKIKVSILYFCRYTKNIAKDTSLRCINTAKCIMPKNDTSKSISEENIKVQNINSKEKYSFMPSINHITQSWHKMSKQTRIVTLSILVAIIIIPLIFALLTQSHEDVTDKWPEIPEESPTYQSNTEIPQEPIQSESQNTLNNSSVLLSDDNIITTTILNEQNIGITKNTITLFKNTTKEDYTLPADAGEITHIAPMDDLDLLFILTTQNKLYTFSPTEKKFTNQQNIPSFNHTDIKSLGTYMTYLYTLNDTTIMRYTRAENGFEKGDQWLKEPFNFTDATSFTIDDNIYTAQKGSLVKFTKGKKDSFTQDTAIKYATLVYTTEDTQYMWILDTQNNTLYKTKKNTGQKIEEYRHADFSNAKSFVVNEKTNTILISNSNNILSFSLQ